MRLIKAGVKRERRRSLVLDSPVLCARGEQAGEAGERAEGVGSTVVGVLGTRHTSVDVYNEPHPSHSRSRRRIVGVVVVGRASLRVMARVVGGADVSVVVEERASLEVVARVVVGGADVGVVEVGAVQGSVCRGYIEGDREVVVVGVGSSFISMNSFRRDRAALGSSHSAAGVRVVAGSPGHENRWATAHS